MLSLVLPTFNEAENLPVILPRLAEILRDISFEIIIVDDDSPDETWRIAQEMATRYPSIRVIRRIGRRGLSSAAIEGFEAAKGTVLALADADGQHDYTLLPALYRTVREHGGVAVGSRYVEGGGVGEWNESRHFLSRLATAMAKFLCRVKIRDPMSGYFVLDRTLFQHIAPSLNPRGFKILLAILLRVPRGTHIAELPYTFGVREKGQSKLSLRVQLAFLRDLLDAVITRFTVPLLFTLILVVLALWIVPRAWALRALYENASLRSQVQHSLQIIADERGWLLSDMRMSSLSGSTVTFFHEEHRRHAPPPECFVLSVPSSLLKPCAK